MEPILEISDLSVSFPGKDGPLTAIDDVNLVVRKGETLAVIGESGSGKSILGLSIIRLLPSNAQVTGSILFNGTDLLSIHLSEIESIRGRTIAWIPQNPKTSFNPSMKMWKQIAEPAVAHLDHSWKKARIWAVKQLETYNILPAEFWAEEYPVTYSGGMLQRATIAMGTSTNPDVIIADEPTKGIDRITKVDIIEKFVRLKETGITLVLITHDLDFAADLADRIVVIYCGQIVEILDSCTFLQSPLHPYSKGLIQSLPQNGLSPIPGTAPPMHMRFSGCRFRERCTDRVEQCNCDIRLSPSGDGYVRCIKHDTWNRVD
nr:ABC transporter ATP-binding protein [uncultured Methanospirillum sp.]